MAAGDYLYASERRSGLRVIDVRDGMHPIERGQYPAAGLTMRTDGRCVWMETARRISSTWRIGQRSGIL